MRVNVRHRIEEEAPQGTVILRMHIDKLGAVRRVMIFQSSGNPDLDLAAIRTAWQTKFKPYLVKGNPIAVTVMMPMHFQLK